MKQEAADELDRIESHDAAAVVMSGVAPAKANLPVVETEQPSVGDGDSVSVAGQILQRMLGSAERRLRINYPLSSAQTGKQRVKRAWRGEFGIDRYRAAPSAAGPRGHGPSA